jgi:hypothetical protein
MIPVTTSAVSVACVDWGDRTRHGDRRLRWFMVTYLVHSWHPWAVGAIVGIGTLVWWRVLAKVEVRSAALLYAMVYAIVAVVVFAAFHGFKASRTRQLDAAAVRMQKVCGSEFEQRLRSSTKLYVYGLNRISLQRTERRLLDSCGAH